MWKKTSFIERKREIFRGRYLRKEGSTTFTCSSQFRPRRLFEKPEESKILPPQRKNNNNNKFFFSSLLWLLLWFKEIPLKSPHNLQQLIRQTDMKSITKLICSSSGHKNSLWLLFLVSKFRARPIFLCKSTVLRLGPRKLIINLVGILNVIHISFNENIPCDGWSRAQHASKFFRLLFRIFRLYFSKFLNIKRRRARDRCNTSFTWRVCFVSPRSSDCVRLCARPRGPPSCRSFDPLVSSGWSLSYMSVWCVYGIPRFLFIFRRKKMAR